MNWIACLPRPKAGASSLRPSLAPRPVAGDRDPGEKTCRKVALTGRSLEENVDLARELGYMKIPDTC